ncbi:AraC family transcriptional regulator [Photobacterium alginatilyticum]|uniref:AraC family transcriptional regulator n=1 Tax=Photobacterium alginatilyticum TaxID=1775171 RepID=A0ABW9YPP9_9GAMM|nr:AraC family transcriptional regulator [Photobacterium alginatilyticum]NBI55700.1 AraC family transcriptional regulator [Photobacterium alginatilyticum]
MKQDDSVFLTQCQTLPWVEIRQASQTRACYHSHSHDEFSFGVIDSGSAQYINQKVNNRIGITNTVTINPGDIHSCNPEIGEWSYRMLFVETSWIGQLQSELFNRDGADYHPFLNHYETAPDLYHHFDSLYQALINEPNPLTAESELILYLARCFDIHKAKVPKREQQPLPHLSRVKEMLLDQLDSNLPLEELATEAGLSRYHLIRKFNQVYGLSPHALQLDARVKKAKALLKAGNTLAETSAQLGFADQAHFQRHFKKRLAVTPKQYQSFFV